LGTALGQCHDVWLFATFPTNLRSESLEESVLTGARCLDRISTAEDLVLVSLRQITEALVLLLAVEPYSISQQALHRRWRLFGGRLWRLGSCLRNSPLGCSWCFGRTTFLLTAIVFSDGVAKFLGAHLASAGDLALPCLMLQTSKFLSCAGLLFLLLCYFLYGLESLFFFCRL
jgi:hypothetical protein